MMSTRFLLLWLEGPLQSWGSESKFGRRETQRFPTKSGIYGMFLSALGANGAQVELLKRLSEFKQTIISYNLSKKNRKDDNEIYSKIDSNPFLMDFQMVGSGYDVKDPWQRMLIPKKDNGSAANGGGSKMTYRYYLQDARFAVIQELDEELAQSISEAIQKPIFDIYLGRKNCIPSDFVYRGIFDDIKNAEDTLSSIAEEKGLIADFKIVEGESEGDQIVLHDVPVQFGEWKKYRDRTVTLISL